MTILDQRRAGVLLHPTSLPGGNFGQDALRFIDFMHAAGLTVWQTLPLGPTHDDRSPYHCLSVHAIHPALVCLQQLVERGWLASVPARVDAVAREAALTQAYVGFLAHAHDLHSALETFRREQAYWLADDALYQAL